MLTTHDRAIVLNELANNYAVNLQYSVAIERYKEALSLYIQLAKDKPMRYSLLIANVFTNLAMIHYACDLVNEASEFHQDALKMHKALYKENPERYGVGLACCIIDGVGYLGEHSIVLYDAKLILSKIKGNAQAQELLEEMEALQEEF